MNPPNNPQNTGLAEFTLPLQSAEGTPSKLGGRSRHGLKYRTYAEEDMEKAVQAIIEGSLSLRKAALTFHVPKTTLAERIGDRKPKPPPRVVKDKRPLTRYPWTEDQMAQAVDAVLSGMPVSEAARKYGVPPSNLNSRKRGRTPKDLRGEVSKLTLRQESLLADWAHAQAELGFPPSKDDVYSLAERVFRKTTGDDSRKLGKQWIGHWARRWPKVELLEWQTKDQNQNGPNNMNLSNGDSSTVSNATIRTHQPMATEADSFLDTDFTLVGS